MARYGYAIELASLPIEDELIAQGERLIALFDTSVDKNDPGGPGLWSREQSLAFDLRAKAFFDRLVQALGETHSLTFECM